MREELEYIAEIDRYISGEMSEEESKAFEEKMEADENLRSEVEFYDTIRQGISRQVIKLDIKKAQYRFVKARKKATRLRRLLYGGGSLLLMIIAVLVTTLPGEEGEENFIHDLFNKDENPLPYDSIPAREFFEVAPDEDTTITSKDGLKIHIPKGAFIRPNGKSPKGPVNIELAATHGADDWMLGNLVGNDSSQVLEPEGAVYFNATEDGKPLAVNDELPPYIEMPTDSVKPGMQVYDGKRDKKGNMQWYNPQMPDNFLKPVPFRYLDFLPKGFEKTVRAVLPYKKHQSTSRELLDSLFYSMTEGLELGPVIDSSDTSQENVGLNFGEATPEDIAAYNLLKEAEDSDGMIQAESTADWAISDSTSSCGISPLKIKSIRQEKFERSLLATKEFEERLSLIYESCDEALLMLYVDNTSKKLWELDEMAAEHLKKQGETRLSYQFSGFARQKLTNVPNSHIYASIIAKDYEKDLNAFEKEREKTRIAYEKALVKADKKAGKLAREYYQLTAKRVKHRMKTYGFKVRTMGWKQIARIVEEGETYVPPPLTVTINQETTFDHQHVYFAVPHLKVIAKLNRLSANQFIMNEHRIMNLPQHNADSVHLIGVGYVGKDIYLKVMTYPTDQSGELTMILEKKDHPEARKLLKSLSGKGKKHNLLADLDYQKAFYQEQQRRKKLRKEQELISALTELAFPCCNEPGSQSVVASNVKLEDAQISGDNTNWQITTRVDTTLKTKTGLEIVLPNGKKKYITKEDNPAEYKMYYEMFKRGEALKK